MMLDLHAPHSLAELKRGSEISRMPAVARGLRQMASRLALKQMSDWQRGEIAEAQFLLEAADLIDAQYELLRPKLPRERGVMPPWMPAVISRVTQRVLNPR